MSILDFKVKNIPLLVGILCLVSMASAPDAYASTSSPASVNIAVSSSLSDNWSGYVATGRTYTSVTGTWIVPSVSSSNSTSADATWVGIGGSVTSDLIQAGTQAIIQNGSTLYQAWYELLPDASIPVSMTVSPGNSITTTITQIQPGEWNIQITNNSTGAEFSTSVSYNSSLSSAEWIEEMPSDQVGLLPLDSFGSVPFTNSYAVVNGEQENILQLGARALTMISGQSVASILAYPSGIGSDGASFTVTQGSAYSDVVPHVVTIVQRGFTRGIGGFRRTFREGFNERVRFRRVW